MPSILNGDVALFHWVNTDLTNSAFDLFFPAITDLHKTFGFKFIFVPLALAIFLWFYRKRGLILALGLGLSLALSDKIGSLGKHFWQRPRPFEIGIEVIQRSGAGGFSFPSNHATNMFCLAFFLSSFFPRARWILITFASLVAFSRIYNGVHFPLDVFAGGLLGSFFGIFGAQVTRKVLQKIEFKNSGKKEGHG